MVSETHPNPEPACSPTGTDQAAVASMPPAPKAVEIGGRDGPDPTRYGDWEKNGRCIDF
jgi:hypothetical protein